MRVALTGADGFTGRYLKEEIEGRGWEWVSLSADLTEPETLDAAVAAIEFDALIHLAAIAFVGSGDWRNFYAVNQIGTYSLLDSIARHHPGRTCLLASSAQVYGPAASGLVAETAPCDPQNHYAISKYAMELGAAQWRDRLDIRFARPFNYTGVGQEDRYLIPKIVSHFARLAPVIELGNIEVQRDFGDVRAVASAYCELLSPEAAGVTANIATGRLSSIGDIMATLSRLSGHEMEIRQNPAFMRSGDVPVLGGEVSRLQALAPGWSPRTLDDTLEWMLDEAKRTAGS